MIIMLSVNVNATKMITHTPIGLGAIPSIFALSFLTLWERLIKLLHLDMKSHT